MVKTDSSAPRISAGDETEINLLTGRWHHTHTHKPGVFCRLMLHNLSTKMLCWQSWQHNFIKAHCASAPDTHMTVWFCSQRRETCKVKTNKREMFLCSIQFGLNKDWYENSILENIRRSFLQMKQKWDLKSHIFSSLCISSMRISTVLIPKGGNQGERRICKDVSFKIALCIGK